LIKVCSIFSQLLQLFPRGEFEQLVRKHKAERHARGFSSWSQFVAMMFCQLAGAQSLREICSGLAACEGRLRHLGVQVPPKRSTLAYANKHRPWALYQEMLGNLLERCQREASPRRKFRFRNRLLLIDSTIIDLCSSVFPWAVYQREKGAAKLHLVLDAHGHLPRYAVLTEGKASDLSTAQRMQFERGTILVFDRGYVDYSWYEQLTAQGIFFVTRMRHDAHYQVLQEQPTEPDSEIICDQAIRLGSPHYVEKSSLRRIQVRVEPDQEPVVLLTNIRHLVAHTISAIYRERWQIEVFFRVLKQNLRVKTFVGTSANALKVQIWTALIAILLLKYLQLRSTFTWSLSNLVALLRHQLFVYRDLFQWLNQPWEPPPTLDQMPQQLFLAV
jgi:Domain of unknown function (DUF4372)/Transposase DDE domain